MPDSREMATAILLLGFVVFGLAVRGVRERIPDFIRSAAPLLWLLAVYLASAALVVWGAWSIRLWVADLWWSTSIVVLGLGTSLVSSAVGSRSVRALWDSIASKTVGAAVFIGLLHQPRPVLVDRGTRAPGTGGARGDAPSRRRAPGSDACSTSR